MSRALEFYHRNRERLNAERRAKYKIDPRIRELALERLRKYVLRNGTDYLKNQDKLSYKEWKLKYPEQYLKKIDTNYLRRKIKYLNSEEFRESERNRLRKYSRLHQHNKRTSGRITLQIVNDLIKKCNGTCPLCGRKEPEIKLSIDHIIPVCRGGTNHVENLQMLCLPCNQRKGKS